MHHRHSAAAAVAPATDRSRPFVMFSIALMLAFALVSGTLSSRDATAQSDVPVAMESPIADRTELSVADVAEQANDAVVTVYTFVNQTRPEGLDSHRPHVPGNDLPAERSGAAEPTPLGAGSGWIFSKDGHVITNAHVVSGAGSFVVQYANDTQVEAVLVGTDTLQDVAVLKLNLLDGETVPGVARIGDSLAMRAGDEVVAMGSPLGEFTNSVSHGNIGGLNRTLRDGSGLGLANLIQHDAEISSGNSGGPLLNMYGDVIGMNVAKIDTASMGGTSSASGLNFAIDGNIVVGIATEIIDTGASIGYPYIGVQTQPTTTGLMIVAVEPTSPAAASGLQVGDILVGVNHTVADANTSFMAILMQHRPGDSVLVVVERDGMQHDIQVTLGERLSA